MDHKERFFLTIEREKTDYPASWLGIPDSKALKNLCSYYQADSYVDLKRTIGDDVFGIEIPYHSPDADAIYTALNFKKPDDAGHQGRTLTAPGFFQDYDKPESVDLFDWPDPALHIDPEECSRSVDTVPKDFAVLGVVWASHFQDSCSAFGMEDALMKIFDSPELFTAVGNRITEFYLKACEIFYEATKGKVDAVLIGNDFGSQQGLMLSPELLGKYVFPDSRRLIEQAQSYGLKVIYHSCGAISDIIPHLVEMGVDAIHPIQALAKNMEPERLKNKYGDNISFCGGVDHQKLLFNGTPEETRDRVQYLKSLFPTGLIISPSHEAVLPEMRMENIAALFEAVRN